MRINVIAHQLFTKVIISQKQIKLIHREKTEVKTSMGILSLPSPQRLLAPCCGNFKVIAFYSESQFIFSNLFVRFTEKNHLNEPFALESNITVKLYSIKLHKFRN